MFRAWDSGSSRPVAVKLFKLDLPPLRVHQLASELERIIAADLAHPALAASLATGIHDGCAFLAQEFVAADSLDLVVGEFGQGPPADALRVATQLAGALDFAAVVNLAHGALHPRDVLLSSDETRLTGVGVAQALERVGVVVPVRRPYGPPERSVGRAWDRRADVFSLAALVHELLWGRRKSGMGAHAVESLTGIQGCDLSALRATFARALAEDPDRRFDTALGFAQALKDAFPDVVAAPVPAPKPKDPIAYAVQVDLPMSPLSAAEGERYQDVEVIPAIFESEPRPPTDRRGTDDHTDIPLQPGPLPALERSRLLVRQLALAAIIGVAVGFAAGYGVGTREPSARRIAAAAPTATTAYAPVGREFTESAVAEVPAHAAASRSPVTSSDVSSAKSDRAIGRLLVRSSPAGASVFVDGRGRGQTPAAVRDLSSGAHRVRVARDGYTTEVRQVVITPSRPAQSVTVELARLRVPYAGRPTPSQSAPAPVPSPVPAAPGGLAPFTGMLAVDSRPTGAKVFLDGVAVGTTPMVLQTVRAGEHAVRLERDGYRRWSSSVRVVSSERNRITASLER